MSDKKNEDFVVRMPDSGFGSAEKDAFKARSPSRRPLSMGSSGGLPSSLAKVNNSPPISVLAYCLSSISMTVVNKYVVSGTFWNLNFFYLAIQVRHLVHTMWDPT